MNALADQFAEVATSLGLTVRRRPPHASPANMGPHLPTKRIPCARCNGTGLFEMFGRLTVEMCIRCCGHGTIDVPANVTVERDVVAASENRRTGTDRREDNTVRLLAASSRIAELASHAGRIRMREQVVSALRASGFHEAADVVAEVAA